MTADHLTPTVTDRGFRHMPPLRCPNGDQIRLHESSAAGAPHAWLAVKSDGHEQVAHVDANTLWQLREQIDLLLKHHFLGDARPTTLREAHQ